MYSSTPSLTWRYICFGGQGHTPVTLLTGRRPNTHFTIGWVGPTAGL